MIYEVTCTVKGGSAYHEVEAESAAEAERIGIELTENKTGQKVLTVLVEGKS